MSFLRERIVLITGATGGLGKEMVKQFLEEGCKLILTDVNQENMTDLVNKFEMKNRILLSIESDLSTLEGVKKVYDTVKYNNLDIDFLINNAGIASMGLFCKTPEDEWERQFAINLLAPIRLTKLFLNDMQKRNSGHLVNIASVASFVASPGLATYSSTKHGLRAFGEALSEELKSTRIKVTNLYPFFTKTPMIDSPQFGYFEKKQVPEFLMSSPREVVRELIYGIKRNDLHVFPGVMSKTTELMSRFVPEGMSLFFKFLK